MNHSGHNMNMSTTGGDSGADNGMGLKFSLEVENILFQNWSTKSILSYILAIVIVFAASGLLEFLNAFKQRIYQTYTININDPHLRLSKWKNVWRYKLILMVLHIISLGFHYALMLVIMTFNLGLVFSVLIGAGAGYIVFLDNPIYSSSTNNNQYISMKDTTTTVIGGSSTHCSTPSSIIINSFENGNNNSEEDY